MPNGIAAELSFTCMMEVGSEDRQRVAHTPGFRQDDDSPVVGVSWNDAEAFCLWLQQQEHRACRLPTEAEWEYACRSGTTTRFSTGDSGASLEGAANVADVSYGHAAQNEWLRPTDWDDGHIYTAPVGSYAANAFGLHDMHGNVYEWCADCYVGGSRLTAPLENPTGGASAAERCLRGGSWHFNINGLTSTARNDDVPTFAADDVGFRVVMSLRQDEAAFETIRRTAHGGGAGDAAPTRAQPVRTSSLRRPYR